MLDLVGLGALGGRLLGRRGREGEREPTEVLEQVGDRQAGARCRVVQLVLTDPGEDLRGGADGGSEVEGLHAVRPYPHGVLSAGRAA